LELHDVNTPEPCDILLDLQRCIWAQQPFPCPSCAEWNAPQAPFRIYGNTYYVGPHGLSSILITSHEGHVLIDGGLAESAGQIASHIRQLGFRVEDVKLIVNSHVHFDHAGGIAELQRLSGARVVASKWTADVMTKTGVGRNDPQYGSIPPIALIKQVEVLSDGQTFKIGSIVITAHLTPGHTPGGTSWNWQSCGGAKCVNFVFADSLTPVSADGFKFTHNNQYPAAIQDFQKSFSFLRSVPCDILLTTHPDVSNFWDRVDARAKGTKPDPMVDTAACRVLADRAEDALRKRIASEAAQ
jgi:metallo-beta-lactamase class B